MMPRPVVGRVIDREGKGVGGVSVFQVIDGWVVTTDGTGRFHLDEVPGGPAFVFAEKAGFRFGGAIVGPAEEKVDIRLARVEEPPLSIPKPQPPPLSRAEERAMAREWIGPLVAEARAGSLGHIGQSVIPTLARVDPDRVLEMIENRVVTPSPDVLTAVVAGQFESDPAAAVATIEADRDPAIRAGCFLAIADTLPSTDRAGQTPWMERPLAETRRVEDKEARLSFLGKIAGRWLDLGQLDRARPLLREGRSILATMPPDRYSPAAEPFAQVLAAIDLPTARPILERRVLPTGRGNNAIMSNDELAAAPSRWRRSIRPRPSNCSPAQRRTSGP